MGTKHNLNEFALSKDVVKDHPKIQRIVDKAYIDLYKYREYFCVTLVLDSLSETRGLLERQYKQAKVILDKKGAE